MVTAKFYRNYYGVSWNATQVRPCKTEVECENGQQWVSQCEPEEADFWSVYITLDDGRTMCVADLPDRKSAEALEIFINSLVDTYERK